MNRSERKYILILSTCVVLFVLYQVLGKKPYDWTITLKSGDKNPFGTYVLNETLPEIFPGGVDRSYLTAYELQDSSFQGLFILTTDFYPGEEDMETLLNRAENGDHILISAFSFSYDVADTLGFEVQDYSISPGLFDPDKPNTDSLDLRFVNSKLPGRTYRFPVHNTYTQLGLTDSTSARIVAVNDRDIPVMLEFPIGKGSIYINSTPLIFTNHFMLQKENYRLASEILSFLPADSLHWTEYYQTGRMESPSPLRYFLSNEALTWGYYLLISGLLLFMVFEARRKQRIIPVITPLRNSTLDFVRTISNLYYDQEEHKNIAEKRISFFMDRIRKAYFLRENLQGKALYEKVAAKSGHSFSEVEELFTLMYRIRSKPSIQKEELQHLNSLIENFRI